MLSMECQQFDFSKTGKTSQIEGYNTICKYDLTSTYKHILIPPSVSYSRDFFGGTSFVSLVTPKGPPPSLPFPMLEGDVQKILDFTKVWNTRNSFSWMKFTWN